MAQPKPERIVMEQVLKLADTLLPEEQQQLIEEMKIQWLGRAMANAEESLDRGEGIPVEHVLAELKQRAENRLREF